MGSCSRKKNQDLELEKARLISLALDFGFDESSAKKCLHRLIDLYGAYAIACLSNPLQYNSVQCNAIN